MDLTVKLPEPVESERTAFNKPQEPTSPASPSSGHRIKGGRFDFNDEGTYCGGWEDGKAEGHGVCTGPKGMGEYSGSWHLGFEVSGIYIWPNKDTYEGQWSKGRRDGLGIEHKGVWVYKGEWTGGLKGRYGTRQSLTSGAKYEGTWANGLQDGYGMETYADGGTYQGQWLRGMRHGYGVRKSVPYGLASRNQKVTLRDSLTSLRSEGSDTIAERDKKLDESRGGFVLKARSDELIDVPRRMSVFQDKKTVLKERIMAGFRIKRQRSAGDLYKRTSRETGSIRSTHSVRSVDSLDSTQSGLTSASLGSVESAHSFVAQDDINDPSVTETYAGEFKNDKRSGFGVCERSDGLKYEGEWYGDKKYGYGITTFKDGTKEAGKYKNNVMITNMSVSNNKAKIFLIRQSKLRERLEAAVSTAIRTSQIAIQKAEIAVSRCTTAKQKADDSEVTAKQAREDSDRARITAKQFAPDFHQPGCELMKKKLAEQGGNTDTSKLQPVEPDQSHIKRTVSLFTRKKSTASISQDPTGSSPGRGKMSISRAIEIDELNKPGQQEDMQYGSSEQRDASLLLKVPNSAAMPPVVNTPSLKPRSRLSFADEQSSDRDRSHRYDPEGAPHFRGTDERPHFQLGQESNSPSLAGDIYEERGPYRRSEREQDYSRPYVQYRHPRHPTPPGEPQYMNRKERKYNPEKYDDFYPQEHASNSYNDPRYEKYDQHRSEWSQAEYDSIRRYGKPDRHGNQWPRVDDADRGQHNPYGNRYDHRGGYRLHANPNEPSLMSKNLHHLAHNPNYNSDSSSPRSNNPRNLPIGLSGYNRNLTESPSVIDYDKPEDLYFLEKLKAKQESRRMTMPSIMNADKFPALRSPPRSPPRSRPLFFSSKKSNPTIPHMPEAYVVEEGVRKRIKAEKVTQNHVDKKSTEDDSLPAVSSNPAVNPSANNPSLPSKYTLLPALSDGRRNSLPDAHELAVEQRAKTPMSREEISVLSALRREEVRNIRSFMEKEAQTFFLFRSSVRNWLWQRKLSVFLVIINVALCYLFYELIS